MQDGQAGDGQVFQEGMVPSQEHDPQEHAYNVVPDTEANRVQMTSQGAEQTE